jgi:hypothetical protein
MADVPPEDAEFIILANMEANTHPHDEAPPTRMPEDKNDHRRKRSLQVNQDPKHRYSSTMPEDMMFNIMSPPSFHLGSVGAAPVAPIRPTTDRAIVMIPVGRITDAARPYKRDDVWIKRAGSIAFARVEVDEDGPEGRRQFVDTTGTYIAAEHI